MKGHNHQENEINKTLISLFNEYKIVGLGQKNNEFLQYTYSIEHSKNNPLKTNYLLLSPNSWFQFSVIITKENTPEILLSTNIKIENYNYGFYRLSTKKYPDIENTRQGGKIAKVLEEKYSIFLRYEKEKIEIYYNKKLKYITTKILNIEIKYFNKLKNKLPLIIENLTKDIKKNPKKYEKIESIW